MKKRFSLISILIGITLIVPFIFADMPSGGGAGDMPTNNLINKVSDTAIGTNPIGLDFDYEGANMIDGGVIFLREQANADTDVANQGQFWVQTGAPNLPYFTDDAGTDWQLGLGGAIAGASYITQVAEASLTGEQNLAALSTGIMRSATTTGVITTLTDSSGIAANISDETGTGALVFGTSPAIATPTGIIASDIEMGELGTATYDDVQDWSNLTQSAGHVSGFAVTDSGSGEVDVAAGTGIIKTTDSVMGANLYFDHAGTTNLALTDNSINWVYIDYNAGTPTINATADWSTLDLHTQIIIGKVYRAGTVLHFSDTRQELNDLARRVMQMTFEVSGATRAQGMILTTTNQYIESTAGGYWEALNRTSITAKDTDPGGGADTFSYWHQNGGTWTEVATQTQIDNTQYNNTGSGLVTLTNNRYGVHWVFMDLDDHLNVVYGTGDYVLAQAEASQVPVLPPLLTDFSILIGKIIIQKSAAATTSTESAFDEIFVGVTASDHGGLGGLADDDHTQYFLASGTREAAKVIISNTGGLQTGTTAADTLLLQAYDNDTGPGYITFGTLTAGNTPTFDLSTSVTIGSNAIADSSDKLDFFSATSSAELAGVISDETGTGLLCYATSPTFTTDIDVTGGADIDADGVDIDASNSYAIGGTDVIADAAGTATLSNIDAIDATTETTLEAAIDALSNLVTVGALNAGSITSGFGSIDTGADNIVTTGTIGASGAALANGVIATTQSASDNSTKVSTTAYTDAAVAAGGGGGVDYQIFTSDGTWTKPGGANFVEVIMIGGGAGGGSSSVRATGNAHIGGGGGGAGGMTKIKFSAASLGATETITVGEGGAGGAAVTVDNTAVGNVGTGGEASTFGAWATAVGGDAGDTYNAAGDGSVDYLDGFTSQAAAGAGAAGGSQAAGANAADLQIVLHPTGGGGGAGISAGDAIFAGGTGGERTVTPWKALAGGTAGASDGGAGGAGNGVTANEFHGGTAGGGGGSSTTSNGGAGGNGGIYGAGGGGGAATLNGNDSGKGGDGADGIIIVITYL